jgi:dTDP-4-dehydrorhamnose 3,5-epimerase
MIDGVVISHPKVVVDRRGAVMRILRTDDPHFCGFGEVYFSIVNPGIVKGWKRHRNMTMTLSVPVGRILLILYDDRPESLTKGDVQEVELGPHDYKVVTVPPMLWASFMGMDDRPSLLTNCASIPHTPEEADDRNVDDPMFPYHWR